MTEMPSPHHSAHVPVMGYDSVERFLEVTGNGTRPAIVAGALAAWKAPALWTRNYFLARYADRMVHVSTSRDGVFRGDPDKGFSHVLKPMSFGSFLQNIDPAATPTERYYLQQLPLAGPFAALLNDLTTPRYIVSSTPVCPRLWLGPAGNVSALHFDGAQNLLAQVVGRKKVILFAPDQTERLYPHPRDSKVPYMSRVDIDHPDFDAFPQFRDAVSMELTLEPGQMLFIPFRWWHQVKSLEMSISVNFWWNPPQPDRSPACPERRPRAV